MRRALALSALIVVLSASAAGAAQRWSLDIRGGSKLCAKDAPVLKGSLYLFHRCQDGTFVSLSAKEVLRVREETVAERPRTASETVLKRDLEGPAREPDAEPDLPPPSTLSYGTDYGYYAFGWGGFCCAPPVPQPPPGPPPPVNVRPNGFPLVGPPGFYAPPPIGSNGFPILSPPPAAQPR